MKMRSTPGSDSVRKLIRMMNIESVFYVFLAAACITVIILIVFGKPKVLVSGMSMYPTYREGDYLNCSKVSEASDLERGDIVIFSNPESEKTLLIKRLIALPGDTVFMDETGIYVNGTLLSDGFPIPENAGVFSEVVTVPEGTFVAIGDNRNHSKDSRVFGAVEMKNLKYTAEGLSSFSLLSYFPTMKGE